MRPVLRFAIAVCVLSSTAFAQDPAIPARAMASGRDGIPAPDRIRLAEAFRLADELGDSVWTGWNHAPFGILLVTPDREFLIRHPLPVQGFDLVGYDSLLGARIFARPRTMPTGLLATYPALDTVPVIVVGQAELTGRRSTSWVLTILHEHFHQWQMSSPRYSERVTALGLARGDTTGMWMLNYAFPYRSAAVRTRFDKFSRDLVTATAEVTHERWSHADGSLQSQRRLRAALNAADYRYMAFQMWQEGIARYTELQVARLAARRFQASDAFRTLNGFTTFGQEADSLTSEVAAAGTLNLPQVQRVAFYPTGAAYALLLDRMRPEWKVGYLSGELTLDAAPPGRPRSRPRP